MEEKCDKKEKSLGILVGVCQKNNTGSSITQAQQKEVSKNMQSVIMI